MPSRKKISNKENQHPNQLQSSLQSKKVKDTTLILKKTEIVKETAKDREDYQSFNLKTIKCCGRWKKICDNYIACNTCRGWFHVNCVNIEGEDAKRVKTYICADCTSNNQKPIFFESFHQRRNHQMFAMCAEIINCCGKPEVEGDNCIQCNICPHWYHYNCIGLTIQEIDTIDIYVCPGCTTNNQKTTYHVYKEFIGAVIVDSRELRDLNRGVEYCLRWKDCKEKNDLWVRKDEIPSHSLCQKKIRQYDNLLWKKKRQMAIDARKEFLLKTKSEIDKEQIPKKCISNATDELEGLLSAMALNSNQKKK